jgi:hypothetical protein
LHSPHASVRNNQSAGTTAPDSIDEQLGEARRFLDTTR